MSRKTIHCIGGGPGGLYSAILLKKQHPDWLVRLWERNRVDDTFGWGVVFSDLTQTHLRAADAQSYDAITESFATWDAIDVHFKGQLLRSRGHGFCGMSRKKLLKILFDRARELGVELNFEHEVTETSPHQDCDLLIAADGINSRIRKEFAAHFEPSLDVRANRYIWLGTRQNLPAFTFSFRENEHGLFMLHAYQFDADTSTFIVECDPETFAHAELANASEAQSIAYCEKVFAEELGGHSLMGNRSSWINFVTVKNACWHHENIVLLGDAAHTAHFSIGSGTKLAMEDAIALADAFDGDRDVEEALALYERERRPAVASVQRAAQCSLEWFENARRYMSFEPERFNFSLLTRSMRITHDNLRLRDPELVDSADRWFMNKQGFRDERSREEQEESGEALEGFVQSAQSRSGGASGSSADASSRPTERPLPPMFRPFSLRDMRLCNRVVVSPMCQYSAEDGTPNDWHLVHLGSRALGGAGLVIAEMTDVSPDGRISPGCTGMYASEHIEAWKRIVDFVHEHSAAKIAVQLGHAGRKGSTRRMWEGMDQPLEDGNWPLISASPVAWAEANQVPREMTRKDMDDVIGDFVEATERAEQAGFDMVELHMAHGYLLSSFLSPLSNTRQDEYGGSLDNRARFPLQVFDAMRLVWPEHKPMSVRISATDWVVGAFDPGDAVELAKLLKEHGVDLVDVSAGQTSTQAKPEYGRAFQTPFADRIRNEVDIATMAVGNISTYDDINTIVLAGRADLVALARAHLADPYFTLHAAREQGVDEGLWPAQYQSARSLRFLVNG